MFLIAFTKKSLRFIFFSMHVTFIIFHTGVDYLPAVGEHVVLVLAAVGPARVALGLGGGHFCRRLGAARGGHFCRRLGAPRVTRAALGQEGGVGRGAPRVARAALGQEGGVGRGAGGVAEGRVVRGGRRELARRCVLEVHAGAGGHRLHELLRVVVGEPDCFRGGVALQALEQVLGGAQALGHGAVVGEQLLLGARLGGGGGGFARDRAGGGGFRGEGGVAGLPDPEHRLERGRRRAGLGGGVVRGLGGGGVRAPRALQRRRLRRCGPADAARLGGRLDARDLLFAQGGEGVARLGHRPLEDRARRAALPATAALRVRLLDFLRHEVAQVRVAAGAALLRAVAVVAALATARVDSQGSGHIGHLVD